MILLSACLPRRMADQLGPPTTVRPASSYTTSWGMIEFYDIAFRKKLYRSVEELQTDLDYWLAKYNEQRPHSGRYCYGKTPMQTFRETVHIAVEKTIRTPELSDSNQPALSTAE